MDGSKSINQIFITLLALNRCLDYNSKLAGWNSGCDKSTNTFYNQALNTLNVFTSRSLTYLAVSWFSAIKPGSITVLSKISSVNARDLVDKCSIWITDPPYADAINYHELSEFFLAWYEKSLKELFPDWPADSRRALAITGTGEEFRRSMVEVYTNLTSCLLYTSGDQRTSRDARLLDSGTGGRTRHPAVR